MSGDEPSGTHVIECPSCKARSDSIWGIEVRGVYNGVLYWRCMSCGFAWHRFPKGHHLRKKAEREMREAESGAS